MHANDFSDSIFKQLEAKVAAQAQKEMDDFLAEATRRELEADRRRANLSTNKWP